MLYFNLSAVYRGCIGALGALRHRSDRVSDLKFDVSPAGLIGVFVSLFGRLSGFCPGCLSFCQENNSGSVFA